MNHLNSAFHPTRWTLVLRARGVGSEAGAAAALGMSETAVKVAIHRLRVRFRELIRAEVAATVHDAAEVGDELRHLIAIASGGF